MNDSERPASWKQFCTPSELGFRAACNEVVESNLRPINRYVIARLSNSPEARNIFEETWSSINALHLIGVTSEAKPFSFFQALTALPTWRTLVMEEVAAEQRWSDLVSRNHQTIWERAKRLIEKLWDKRQHPAAQTVSTIVVVAAIGVVAARNGTITIPIKPVLDPKSDKIALVFDDPILKDPPPIKIAFSPADKGQEIPLRLKVSSEGTPIKVNLDATASTCDMLKNTARQLTASRSSLNRIAEELNKISVQSEQLNGPDLRRKLGEISNNISLTTQQVLDLRSALVEGLGGQSAVAQRDAEYVDQELQILANASGNDRNAAPIVLGEHWSRTVTVPRFEATTGKSEPTVVRITLTKVNHKTGGDTVDLDFSAGGQRIPSIRGIAEGESRDIPGFPFRLVINSITHRWGSKRASISLVYRSLPIERPQFDMPSRLTGQKVAATDPIR